MVEPVEEPREVQYSNHGIVGVQRLKEGAGSPVVLPTKQVEPLIDLIGPENAAADVGDGAILGEIGIQLRHATVCDVIEVLVEKAPVWRGVS